MESVTTVRLEANGPFHHAGAIAVLAAHRVEGLSTVDVAESTVTRLFDVEGTAHAVTCVLDSAGVTASIDSADTDVVAEIAHRVTRWFDLATDLAPINAHLGQDPLFAEHVERFPGVRITGSPDPFEAVVQTVLGQQVTLAAGRLFGARLVAAYGAPGGRGLTAFPTPAALARIDVDNLRQQIGLTRARARTVHEVANFFGTRPPSGDLPAPAELAALYGVGPWTLSYLAVRAGGDPDAFPSSDAVLRRMMLAAGLGEDAPQRWRPWRSYAAVRLWARSGALD